MQPIEVTAKSLDEAKKVAAEKLGVDLAVIEATVLEESRGLFGKTTLRVSARVKEAAAEKAVVAPAPKEGGRGRRASSSRKEAPVEAPAPVETPEPVAAAPEPAAAPAAGRRGRSTKAKSSEPAEAPAPSATNGSEDEPEVMATQQDADRLADLLRDLVASADLNVTVKASGFSGRYVNIQLDGKDAAFLVGKHGEVLNALQYLVNIIGSRRIANGVRATLDGNDYRKRREDTLTQLAVNIAEQVKKRGEEAVLDALPAFERRIVHKALSTITGITTYSEGEEPNRRVVIAPGE
jgi:spoIIIJ-associated protein